MSAAILHTMVMASPAVRLSIVEHEHAVAVHTDAGEMYAVFPITETRPRTAAMGEAWLLVEMRHNALGLTGALLRELHAYAHRGQA